MASHLYTNVAFVFAALYEGRLKGEAFEWMVLHRWARRLKGGPK